MRNTTRVGVLFIVLLLSFSFVSAWGINPARQRAEHTTNQQYLSVTLENPQGVEGYFNISFNGDLAPYAVYTGPIMYIAPSTKEYVVPFTLTLPDQLIPGKNELKVVFQQIPGGATTNTVASLISLVADVSVDIPLGGNFVTSQLSIGVSEADDPTPITISLINKGEAAVSVWADIVIKGPTNEEIMSWSTEKQVLNFHGNSKIATSWKGVKQPGLYLAEIVLHHGDKSQVLRRSFVVGKKEVVSTSISSDRFSLGSIVPIDISLRNKWNDVLDNVFAEVFVLSEQGAILQSFETPTHVVPALGTTLVTGYWDTAKLVVGKYALNVVVHFPDGQSQRSYSVVVKMDELEVTDHVTGEVAGVEEIGFSQNSLFVILLIVLVVTNVIIIVYFRKMKKK